MKFNSAEALVYGIGLLMAIALTASMLAKDDPPPVIITNKVFTIEGETFPFSIQVIIEENPNRAVDIINSYVEDSVGADDLEEVGGYTFMNSEGRPVAIWLSQMSNDPADIATANHELLHTTLASMHYAGIPLGEESEEAYGYQMQYLSNQFYKQLKK